MIRLDINLVLYAYNETAGLSAESIGLDPVTDAHLAALAIEHQAELYSNGRDFPRSSGPAMAESGCMGERNDARLQ